MSGYYGYYVGQEYDPAPPRLQAYEKHAQQQVLATAARMPATSFFLWILDADGREYVYPFASVDEMFATLRRKNHNFYYYAAFDKTGPVWPKPNGSGYAATHLNGTPGPANFHLHRCRARPRSQDGRGGRLLVKLKQLSI